MLFGNLNNLVASQIRSHRRELASLANNIRFISLLPVHGQAILIAVHRDSLQGQLVRRTENADGNFASIGYQDLLELHDRAVRAEALVHGVTTLVGVSIRVAGAELAIGLAVIYGRHVGQECCVSWESCRVRSL